MCRSLTKAGHEVYLVAPGANEAPRETIDGVEVHFVRPAQSRWERLVRTARDAFKLAASLEGDLYHFHDPEGLLLAPRWQQRLRRPFIYDAHEDYRLDILDKPWISGLFRPIVARGFGLQEDLASKKLAAILVATPAIGERFVHCANLRVIQNFPLLDELILNAKPQKNDSRAFVYLGGISRLRGIAEMVKALEYSKHRATLKLAGWFGGDNVKVEITESAGWNRVEELGMLSRDKVRNLLAASVAGLVLFHPVANNIRAQPNKMFEYMSAGLPIIASDFPLWREIVEGNACGLLVNPFDPLAIAQAMDYLLEHPIEAAEMGRRGRKAVVERYNWENEFPKLSSIYEKVLDQWH